MAHRNYWYGIQPELSEKPALWMDDPAGGDPLIVATFKRIYRPELLDQLVRPQAMKRESNTAVYAIRTVNGRKTLIEAADLRQVGAPGGVGDVLPMEVHLIRVDQEQAEQWVKSGREHETGLWIDDDGAVQYADPES